VAPPELVVLSTSLIESIVAGRREAPFTIPEWWPDAHDRHFLQIRARDLAEYPKNLEWSVRALVVDDEMIGHAGFHGPPGVNGAGKPDAVEIGYTVFPDHRGRGYGRLAAQALVDWASRTHGIRHFVASVAPGNEPSLAIVRGLGFEQTGRRHDSIDGEELVFELKL
jgi:[ribosomal protein S5]-alanine N-acetyltransferase